LEHGTTLLLGLEGVVVRCVEAVAEGARVVHVATAEQSAAACPSCGVFSTSVKGHVTTRPKDLPYGAAPVLLRWHKRRWRCREASCDRQTFTESIPQVPHGARTTTRLRAACADAVAANRSIDEVARAHRVSWPTVQKAVDAQAAQRLGEPAPTRVLGIDETRFGAPRWVQGPDTGTWRLTDPWQTGFVDLEGNQGLLGQVTGRTSAAVVAWLNARDQAWREAIEVVAIDPAAPYRSAVRRALPHATIVVDHFHLVALANQAVTRVRQRVTQEQLARRGRASDPVWANRRLLLRARERLSDQAFARMWNGCIDHDPSNQLLAVWIAKEELRALLATAGRGGQRQDISHRLWRFYEWCARVDVPEVTTLAETVQAWWPQILAFLQLNITNAGTEGTNRLLKQVKRHACGFRNEQHFRDRAQLHSTHNRTRMSARTSAKPAQS
jgi:transposase